MRHQKTPLRKLFGPAGLADYIFPLLSERFSREAAAERKRLRREAAEQEQQRRPVVVEPQELHIEAEEPPRPVAVEPVTVEQEQPRPVAAEPVIVEQEPQPPEAEEQTPRVPLFVRLKAIPFRAAFRRTGGFFRQMLKANAAFFVRVLPNAARRLPRRAFAAVKAFLLSLPNRAVHQFEQLQTWWYRLRVRLRDAKSEISTALREKGLRVASVLVLAVVSLTVTVIFTLGYSVSVNGEEIGVIRSPEELTAMQDAVRRDFENLEMDQTIDLSLTFVQKNRLLDPKSLRQAFLETYDRTIEGAVIQVSGETRAVLPTEEEAFEVLKAMQEKYSEEGAKVTFDQPVEVIKKPIPLSMAVGVESAMELLEGKQSKDGLYTVRPGDSYWSIADAYGMDVDTLMAINQSKNERIVIGDELTVQIPEPYLSVRATRTITYTEEIPYTTRQIEDDGMYRGRSAVVTAGVPGEKEIEATVVKVNGLEVSRDILNETVLSEPTERVLKVGTKTPPRTMATGTFARPTSGYLTSRFGSRWGSRHTGIDIGASTGTPIYAADGGIITMSGWNGGYGKMISINHENGYVTYYAHCSQLLVGVGKRVAKGDLIAYVGNTGRSTGPHLHFEVRRNGTPQNPLNYVSY